ncbi:hypothetical protein PCANC_04630 [Puccinia coronata f. sp. avenae]|uniref:REJ domain-containing protein n=1 Tax=Puccinia coronata f. sp. avenae TaxID=200324 RepID=A0A2N5TU73_9BASI|nr:hypothetical protein PCASD_16254 [Puccinia coronata f. sp. avenae]PLW55658.1 hypothetical protein PCANC_04630 [Puccinia coronata f. sp. avenae]
MLSASTFVACFLVATLAVQASPSPQVNPAASTLNATAARNRTTATPLAGQKPMKNMKANLTSIDSMSPEASTPVTSLTTIESSELEPTSLTASSSELETPTTTTTAAPVVTSSKYDKSMNGTNAKNMKTNHLNTTHALDKKSSHSAPGPFSGSTFELMISLVSVGVLTIVV